VRWFELGADGRLKYFRSSEEAKEGVLPSGEVDVSEAFAVERPDPTEEAPHALVVRTDARDLGLRVNNEAKLSMRASPRGKTSACAAHCAIGRHRSVAAAAFMA